MVHGAAAGAIAPDLKRFSAFGVRQAADHPPCVPTAWSSFEVLYRHEGRTVTLLFGRQRSKDPAIIHAHAEVRHARAGPRHRRGWRLLPDRHELGHCSRCVPPPGAVVFLYWRTRRISLSRMTIIANPLTRLASAKDSHESASANDRSRERGYAGKTSNIMN